MIMTTTCIGIVKAGKLELASPLTLPEGSQVHIILSPLVDEQTARRKANVWLMENVGNVIGKNAQLTQVDDQVIWRFEAFITLPHHAPLGPIGYVDVEAQTGQVLNTPQTAEAMIARGAEFTPTA
jgi:hypothetical protein